jgi:hypothetical protein
MGWVLMNRPRTVRVDKKFACEFANLDAAPHDRPLSERRLNAYRAMFQQGLFRPCTWAKAFCTETNGWYRVNGKHTSILLASMPEIPEFYVTIEEYKCDTLHDVARLYATFDSRIQSRTSRDINVSFAATVPALAEVSGRVVNLSVVGMAYYTWGDACHKKQPAERAELLLEHTDFVLWLNGIVGLKGKQKEDEGIKSSQHLQRGAVAAAMMATWMKVPDKATEFWTAVRDETGARNTLPDRKLAHWLLTTGTLNVGVKTEKRADEREFYARCVTGWNAWRQGKSTDLRYYPSADLPTAK